MINLLAHILISSILLTVQISDNSSTNDKTDDVIRASDWKIFGLLGWGKEGNVQPTEQERNKIFDEGYLMGKPDGQPSVRLCNAYKDYFGKLLKNILGEKLFNSSAWNFITLYEKNKNPGLACEVDDCVIFGQYCMGDLKTSFHANFNDEYITKLMFLVAHEKNEVDKIWKTLNTDLSNYDSKEIKIKPREVDIEQVRELIKQGKEFYANYNAVVLEMIKSPTPGDCRRCSRVLGCHPQNLPRDP